MPNAKHFIVKEEWVDGPRKLWGKKCQPAVIETTGKLLLRGFCNDVISQEAAHF